MTLQTHTEANAAIDALFVVNTAGDIEADDHNTVLSNLTDSLFNVRKVDTLEDTTLTVDIDHSVILVDAATAMGAVTITLPAASGCTNWVKTIKKIDAGANTVTVDANSTELIDGSETQVLTAQYDYLTIVCDGSAWYILASVITP